MLAARFGSRMAFPIHFAPALMAMMRHESAVKVQNALCCIKLVTQVNFIAIIAGATRLISICPRIAKAPAAYMRRAQIQLQCLIRR